MRTFLLFPRKDGEIDAIDERDYPYEAMLELRDYIQGKFVSFGEKQLEDIDNMDNEQVGDLFYALYNNR